jgi:hypothetical protein
MMNLHFGLGSWYRRGMHSGGVGTAQGCLIPLMLIILDLCQACTPAIHGRRFIDVIAYNMFCPPTNLFAHCEYGLGMSL